MILQNSYVLPRNFQFNKLIALHFHSSVFLKSKYSYILLYILLIMTRILVTKLHYFSTTHDNKNPLIKVE